MSFRGYMLLAAGLVFGGALFSQAQKEDGEPPKMVDVRAKNIIFDQDLNTSLGIDERATILVDEVAFHHNGAVISCDSAVRYSDSRIECFKNVIINKDSTFVYGDRVEYDSGRNLARVYSPVIKVINGDAILYTYNFLFNTATNVGRWFGGGVVYQKDNVMESESGYLYPDDNEVVATRSVQMRNDSHRIISDSVRYNSEEELATFYTKTYIWTDNDEIITADRGRYNNRDSTYFFWDDAYILDEFREIWADTIDYAARRKDAIFYGNIQIDDREHESSAFGDFGQYWGSRGETMLTRHPSLLNYDSDQTGGDTLYMRADTVFMFVIYPSDGEVADSLGSEEGQAPDPYSHLRWVDSLSDSVRVAIADSLVPVIADLRSRIASLRSYADSIMDVLYPAAEVIAPAPVDTVLVTDSLPQAEILPDADSLNVKPEPEPESKPEPEAEPESEPEPEPEKIEPPEVVELRETAAGLTLRADSLSAAERYIRPGTTDESPMTPELDSIARLRLDSLARIDSLARLDSIATHLDSLRLNDPRGYKEYKKAENKRLKAERRRLKAEQREAKLDAKEAKRVEKQRLREEKRAAKSVARAQKLAERRRRIADRLGWVTDAARADSLTRADSLITLDSLARLDSLMPALIDSLERLDSLPPAEEPAADTTMRIFRGWHNVKIWRKDMQAVADSMVGFSTDSTLHLYIDPIMWNGSNQITADSITLFTASQKIEHAEFFGDPIMGSQFGNPAARQFNQVKGETMVSWFRDGELYRHDVIERPQALYYMKDEERPDPIAFVVASSEESFSFLFENDSLSYIISRQNTHTIAYPPDKIPPSQSTTLPGFIWQPERQPALEDVFDRRMKPSEREFHEALPRPEFPIADRIDRRREYLISNRMWSDRSDPLPAYAEEFRRGKQLEAEAAGITE